MPFPLIPSLPILSKTALLRALSRTHASIHAYSDPPVDRTGFTFTSLFGILPQLSLNQTALLGMLPMQLAQSHAREHIR